MAQAVGAERQFGPLFLHRAEDEDAEGNVVRVKQWELAIYWGSGT